ncbi:MAG TPA: class I SAM-dependent methyltransferase [Candidatus Eisenbacteria bacterium]|nr:class I SAM-dependent methyltransferase [Candidatus Eisenbacteria bacterium]
MSDAHEAGPSPAYVLGHSDRELDRLKTQARLIDPITQRFFREAGLVPGMRVLDVGSGAGDVAFLAAELVGDTGEVVGVDRAPAALEEARERATARRSLNVTFRDGDPADMTFVRPFDAVIGRYVLQFQKDPAKMLRNLAARVRPGGLVVFHEIDWGGVQSFPPVPTYDQCCRWCVDTLRLSGTETRMGIKLHSTFVAAGLPPPLMRLEALITGGSTSPALLHLVTDVLETLLPEMERLGVATAADVGIETLVERINTEAAAHSSVIVRHFQIGAWSRV